MFCILSVVITWIICVNYATAFTNYFPPTDHVHHTSVLKPYQRHYGTRVLKLRAKEIDDNYENTSMKMSDNVGRRTLLSAASSLPFSLLVLTNQPVASNAAQGAAEYDLEFYIRNLMKGNNDKEGNIQASVPPPLPASRTLTNNSDSSLVQSILNDELNGDCIALRTLSKVTNVPVDEISEMVKAYRTKFSKSFGTRAKWQQDLIIDEYYFDLTCYSLYRTAAALMPSDYKMRDRWVKLLGEEIYNVIAGRVTVKKPSKLTETIPIMVQILDCFQSNSFVSSFRLGDKNDDFRTGLNIFDSYDDEDVDAGLTLNCLISLIRPATLTSSLQLLEEEVALCLNLLGRRLQQCGKRSFL